MVNQSMKSRYDKFFGNNRGSAGLVLAIMLSIGILAISAVFVQRAKIQGLISARQQIDADLDKIMARIGTLVIAPANCNANFYNATPLSSSGSLANLYSCNGVNCRPGPGTPVLIFKAVAPSAPGVPWGTSADYVANLANSNNISSKIRIVGLSYSIAKAADEQSGQYKPAMLTLVVTFEIKLDSNPNSAVKTLPPRSLSFPVVVAADNTMTTTILGCPQIPGDTTLY